MDLHGLHESTPALLFLREIHVPFSMIIAVVTLISIFMSHERFTVRVEPGSIHPDPVSVLDDVYWLLRVESGGGLDGMDRAIKVQALIFVTLLVMRKPERIHLLIWVIVVSIGIYGVKGGIWALMTGGIIACAARNIRLSKTTMTSLSHW